MRYDNPTTTAALSTREFNRRLNSSLAALRKAGAKRIAVEISPNGSTRVYEMGDDRNYDDEAERVGRLIEGQLDG